MREQRPLNARQPANEQWRVLAAGVLSFSVNIKSLKF